MLHTDTHPARKDKPPTTVLLARRLEAPPERVFDAWLDPEQVRKWLLVPWTRDQAISVTIDPAVGGRFSFLIRRGSQEIEYAGGYVELERPRRLAFTWGAAVALPTRERRANGGASLVTLDFAPVGEGTELKLTHEGIPVEHAVRTEEGWSQLIQALANVLSP